MTEKFRLRAEALAKRQALSPEALARASAELAGRLLTLIPSSPHIIAGYVSIRGEIDIFPSLDLLSAQGHATCLPVALEKDAPLLFRAWKPGDALQKGKYNIEIPLDSAPAFAPQILLVPLVAFDHAGHRLGYGAGYYDRTIHALRQQQKGVKVIGIAHSVQSVPQIPAEAHDQKLDAVVTDLESIEFT